MTEDAKPMSGSVTKTLELPASAGEVWAVVGDFNGLPRWNAGVEGAISAMADGAVHSPSRQASKSSKIWSTMTTGGEA
jgi:uncharacterized protein YndB with AHSA1/START domain